MSLPYLVPPWLLQSCITKHNSDKGCSRYMTRDQFVAQSFGQLNKCLTLSDISTGIGVIERYIASLGLTQSPACSTMIPDIVNITPAKVHDRYGIQLVYPAKTITVEDRAYFDFDLMLQRVNAKNVFVTRIKKNTNYEIIRELDLPEHEDQNISLDQIIKLNSKQAIKKGISNVELRLVHVYKEDENKFIEIITNQLDWKARTIADLYKKRWDIELFFKAIKQNLQIKTFLGTSENAVKSQIYIALINYLLFQLIEITVVNKKQAFSNFVKKIRMCLNYYLTIEYVCNSVNEGAKRVRGDPQQKLTFQTDLFS